MAITENGNDMVMPVTPYGGAGDGFNNGWWIILLFIILGGWGGFGGYGNGTQAEVQSGFNQATLSSGINDIQQSLCNGFSGVNSAITNGFANAEIANNSRQIANMQQAFNAQTANAGGFADLATSLQANNYATQLGTADLKYTIATENCADRTALNESVRDILDNQNSGIQRILDTMCQDKIDAKNEKIAELQNQLTMANLASTQNAQTATILANNEAQTSTLEQYLAPVPRPAYVVQNPNCCTNATNCGCGNF